MKTLFSLLWRYKWIALLLGLLTVGGGWWWRSRVLTDEVIVTVRPAFRDINEELEVSGSVNAKEKARLNFPAPSLLTWVGVQEGDRVTKWQAIARVDTQTLHKQMQVDLNTHGKIFRNYEEVIDDTDYYGGTEITDSERRAVESAQLDVRSAVLGVEIRNIAIRLSTLSTPISGVITRIDQPAAGVYVMPTDVIEVVNPESIYFESVVDEEDIAELILGQSAKVVLDAYRDTDIASTVQSIGFSPRVSLGGGTGFVVHLALPLDNAGMRYKLGMNGEGVIILNQKSNVLSIPIDALITRENETVVEVMRNGNLEAVVVSTGIESDEYVEITSGLSLEDEVVLPTAL